MNFHKETLLPELINSSTVENPSIPWKFFPEAITIFNSKSEIISNVLEVCGGENRLCTMFFSANLCISYYFLLCYGNHLIYLCVSRKKVVFHLFLEWVSFLRVVSLFCMLLCRLPNISCWRDPFFSLDILFCFVKGKLPTLCGAICRFSILIHWSMRPFLCQDRTVLMTTAFYIAWSLESWFLQLFFSFPGFLSLFSIFSDCVFSLFEKCLLILL